MSLSIDDVRAQVARVSHSVDGIEFRWNVSRAYEWRGEDGREGIDEEDHVIHIVSESEVVQTMLKAALASAEHRTREWFLVDGVRAYGPHQSVDERKVEPVLRGIVEELRALSEDVVATPIEERTPPLIAARALKQLANQIVRVLDA